MLVRTHKIDWTNGMGLGSQGEEQCSILNYRSCSTQSPRGTLRSSIITSVHIDQPWGVTYEAPVLQQDLETLV